MARTYIAPGQGVGKTGLSPKEWEGTGEEAGKSEELGTKPGAGSQRSGHHWERPTRTVGMVGKDQPWDRA